MLAPTARLLELLELLQAQTLITGREIAGRLGIDARTVRRYVAALQELGIPVEGQRGVGGGYRIRPGFRLPPLMLNDDEAVVVALGVVAAGRLGLTASTDTIEAAQAKIHRVLPDVLRRRVEALEATLDFTTAAPVGAPVAGETVLLLADAIRRRRRLRVAYRSFAGDNTRRELSPHGVEVVLALPLEEATQRLPATLAELADTEAGTLLRMRVSSLDWMASVLAGLGCDFTIRAPEGLRASVRALADRLAA